MHLTLDLVAGTANYVGLDADKESEKHHRPFADELKDTLVLMDAGYFDIEYCKEINQFKGFYLMRAGKSINPEVVDYLDPDTHERISCHKEESGQTSVVKLNKLNIGKYKLVDLTVKWWKFDETFRVIQFWDRKTKNKAYLITNLPVEQFSAQSVLELYSLRWQVELFFKELKSYCSMKKVNTADPNIVKSLLWGSILSLLIKRFVAFHVGLMFGVMIATHKVARTALHWLPNFMHIIFNETDDENEIRMIEKIFKFLSRWAARAHPERDSNTALFQLGMKLYAKQ